MMSDNPNRRQSPVRHDLEKRQTAAEERRHWVRLTRRCNNRCAFCLDTGSHDGSFVSKRQINAEIIDGRRAGATRLILSGGEPTIHPSFLSFVAMGRKLGYQRVQTITNGRLFAYERFLDRAVRAGLGEVTFSIHGHDARTHDFLVGVPGAFDETIRGLRNALSNGRLIVNVDVCLNGVNIEALPRLLDGLMELGVREFDLLHIVPFGRAYEDGSSSLFYEIEEAMPSIQYALSLAKREDVHIWFNRFPPPYLEGHEHLIQDPVKLLDEVRGRREEFDCLLETGNPLSCRQPDRCRRCYIHDLCENLEATLEAVRGNSLEVYRATLGSGSNEPVPTPPCSFATSWVRAPDAATAAAAADAARLPGDTLFLELDSYANLEELLREEKLAGRRVLRAYASTVEHLEELLSLPGSFEVVAYLDKTTAPYLLQLGHQGRLVVTGRTHNRLTDAVELDPDLESFFTSLHPSVPVEGIPACICKRTPRPSPRTLDASMLRADGRLDIFGYTRRFILEHYRTKSHRCRSCSHSSNCRGAHVNWVRAHGYRALQPLTEPASRS